MNRIFIPLFLFCAIFFLSPQLATAITIDTVPVGNPGNSPDQNFFGQGQFGAVAYSYRIGKTEVTNAQYAAFLNAKAASDPLGLYNINMGSTAVLGGITRSGSDGSYSYATILGHDNMPVNWVSWYDAIRFANWLNNGQGNGDTETGAYTLGELDAGGVPLNGNGITRNAGARWFLTSENEWYKAAFYNPSTGTYFQYPTSSDTVPTKDAPPGGSNSANYFVAGPTVVAGLTNVGAYTETKSPYGAFDMGGNVYERNEALIGGSFRGLRGGSFFSMPTELRSWARGNDADPSHAHYTIGFRVASVPEPTSLCLAVLALAGALLIQRRQM